MHARPVALILVAALAGAAAGSCAPKTAAAAAAVKGDPSKGGVPSTEQSVGQRASPVSYDGPSGSVGPPPTQAGKQDYVVQDAQLGMAAFTVHAPPGWRVQGRTAHDAGCGMPPEYIEWSAESPDGSLEAGYSSGVKYGAASDPQVQRQQDGKGCVRFQSESTVDFLQQAYLTHAFPGARIVSISAMPDSDPMMQAQRQKVAALSAQHRIGPGEQGRFSQSGAIARIVLQHNGRTFEASLTALTWCFRDRVQMPGLPSGETLDCTMSPVFFIRAPEGQLDRVLTGPALVTASDNPAYTQRVAQIRSQRDQQAMQQIASDAQARNQGIIAQGQANMANIRARGEAATAAFNQRSAMYSQQNQAFRANSDANHQSAQAFARSMGDQAQFQGPNGQSFNASNQYSHTYVGPNGQVLQTNSAYPPGPGWTEAQGR